MRYRTFGEDKECDEKHPAIGTLEYVLKLSWCAYAWYGRSLQRGLGPRAYFYQMVVTLYFDGFRNPGFDFCALYEGLPQASAYAAYPPRLHSRISHCSNTSVTWDAIWVQNRWLVRPTALPFCFRFSSFHCTERLILVSQSGTGSYDNISRDLSSSKVWFHKRHEMILLLTTSGLPRPNVAIQTPTLSRSPQPCKAKLVWI